MIDIPPQPPVEKTGSWRAVALVVSVVLAVSAVLAGLAYWGRTIDRSVERDIQDIEAADPLKDAQASLERNDLRFIAVYTLRHFTKNEKTELFAPGVPSLTDEQALRKKCHVLEWTNRSGLGNEEDMRWSMANDYARRYNLVILEELRKRGASTQ